MAIRGIGDAYAFQRLLWLLVGTVIVPTVLLTLYGVMAIRNQQAAIEEQVRRDQEERLRVGASMFFEEVAGLDQAVRTAVLGCELPCAPRPRGISAAWGWRDEPPPLAAAIALPDSGDTVWHATPQGTIGIFVVGERKGAWLLDDAAIEGMVTRTQRRASEQFPEIHLNLRRTPAGPATPVEEIMARWETDRFEAVLPLERPLAGFEVQLTYLDDDPVRAILGPTRWLYPLGLVALVATVMAGTVITLNSASREIRLSRLQTDFVSNVSHELRTPLTSIRMFVETLQSGRLEDPERVAECLDLLGQETDRLSRMIERVLSWARMEAGRRTYDAEPVVVEDLVQDALSALRSHTLMEPTEGLRTELGTVPPVAVDRDAIVEALVNLLQNAVKYTPPPREIVVRSRADGDFVGISVSDNGPGIAPTDRKRVFEKFYQADTRLSSHVGANRGSGLGLSIVRAVVRGHGGRVELESEVDRGSTFTLWLPVAR
ncbi:MAG: ATP-binding protein [Myxococcota bacterium]